MTIREKLEKLGYSHKGQGDYDETIHKVLDELQKIRETPTAQMAVID